MGEEIFLSKTSISNMSLMFLHVRHITQGSFSDYSASVGVCGAGKPQNEDLKLDALAVRTSTAARSAYCKDTTRCQVLQVLSRFHHRD